MTLPPAGWYLDEPSAATTRWWSGDEWTEHRQPMDATPAKPTAIGPGTVLSWVSLVLAVASVIVNPAGVVSVVAIVFGAVGLARAKRSSAGVSGSREAAAVGLTLGVVTLLVWGALFLTGRAPGF